MALSCLRLACSCELRGWRASELPVPMEHLADSIASSESLVIATKHPHNVEQLLRRFALTSFAESREIAKKIFPAETSLPASARRSAMSSSTCVMRWPERANQPRVRDRSLRRTRDSRISVVNGRESRRNLNDGPFLVDSRCPRKPRTARHYSASGLYSHAAETSCRSCR